MLIPLVQSPSFAASVNIPGDGAETPAREEGLEDETIPQPDAESNVPANQSGGSNGAPPASDDVVTSPVPVVAASSLSEGTFAGIDAATGMLYILCASNVA